MLITAIVAAPFICLIVVYPKMIMASVINAQTVCDLKRFQRRIWIGRERSKKEEKRVDKWGGRAYNDQAVCEGGRPRASDEKEMKKVLDKRVPV